MKTYADPKHCLFFCFNQLIVRTIRWNVHSKVTADSQHKVNIKRSPQNFRNQPFDFFSQLINSLQVKFHYPPTQTYRNWYLNDIVVLLLHHLHRLLLLLLLLLLVVVAAVGGGGASRGLYTQLQRKAPNEREYCKMNKL